MDWSHLAAAVAGGAAVFALVVLVIRLDPEAMARIARDLIVERERRKARDAFVDRWGDD